MHLPLAELASRGDKLREEFRVGIGPLADRQVLGPRRGLLSG
jgi:hypothetical protein